MRAQSSYRSRDTRGADESHQTSEGEFGGGPSGQRTTHMNDGGGGPEKVYGTRITRDLESERVVSQGPSVDLVEVTGLLTE